MMWSRRQIALLALVASIPSSAARQAFAEEPRDVEVNPGDRAVLPCRVRDKSPNSLCIWQRDGRPVRAQRGKYEWNDGVSGGAGGDCGLTVLEADIDYDDGDWRCQVTPSSFDQDDALSSTSARLTVRIPPDGPKIFFKGRMVSRDGVNLTVKSGEEVDLRCESRGGNPPAVLRWTIVEGDRRRDVDDGNELSAIPRTRNETDPSNRRRWDAISEVRTTFAKEQNGRQLRCSALHDAFAGRSRTASATLDVLFPPSLRLERGRGLHQLEADVDSVRVKCTADGNPKPRVRWRKAGADTFFRNREELVFDPVRQSDGGTYSCAARNDEGSSTGEVSVTFDVLYEPRNVRTEPAKALRAEVGERASVECFAHANPQPRFQWVKRVREVVGDDDRYDDGDRRNRRQRLHLLT